MLQEVSVDMALNLRANLNIKEDNKMVLGSVARNAWDSLSRVATLSGDIYRHPE